MKQKNRLYLYVFITILFSNGFLAQEITLKLSSKKKLENIFLEKINYKKLHRDTSSISLENDKISNYLKNIGYFTNTIDSTLFSKGIYTSYFSLNEKIDNAIIKINPKVNLLLEKVNIKNNSISLPINKVQATLNYISKELEKEGKAFSKVYLKNVQIKNKTLFAELTIHQSKKRKINNIYIKGYKDFPNPYIKHYYNIKEGTVFNQQKIKEISSASKNLNFIREIKPPEVLFTKDSTLLYIYLKKNQNNSFDGMVNFSSKENGGLLFNGHIDLKLNNILNKGEKFEFYWNNAFNQSQEFEISSETPYIFNSIITPSVSFSIYKQDSTFIKTRLNTNIYYNINARTRIATTYSSENSENLQKNIENNIETYSNFFIGLLFEYKIPKNDYFFNEKFLLKINPSVGNRKADTNSSSQFKIESTTSYIWDFNLRSSLFLLNRTGYINSDNFIDNELFRIGGANSIRGIDDLSILTSSYSFFNIEYRYLTANNSYLYTITDIGRANKQNLTGFGIGYLFNIKKSQIKLSLAKGRSSTKKIDKNSTKIILSVKSYF